MSLKDKWNEYKEEKERKDYFRERNDLYVDSITMTKTMIAGLLAAIVGAVIVDVITSTIGIRNSYFYIVLGGVVGNVVKYVSSVQSKQMGILAAILTVVGCMLAHFVFFVYMFGLLNMFSALFFSVTSIFSDVFSIVFLILGACIAYQTAR